MHKLSSLLSIAILVATIQPALAEDIDGGRGAIPLVVPDGYDKDAPAPLVVLLHGYTSSGKGQEGYMKFGKLADEYGYFLLAPDGTKEESGRNSRFWNATDACCNFQGSEVDDSAYVRGLIDQVKSKYSIDANRVFLIGHSNGGFMSYRMAHDHPDTIAAIASLAGATYDEHPTPKSPVHVLQIHGTEDTTILYEGGKIAGTFYPGAKESVERWAGYNGCAVEAKVSDKTIDLDKSIEGDETTITQYTTKCNPGGATELWSIQGGGHIPRISDSFTRHVIDWLYAHPKS